MTQSFASLTLPAAQLENLAELGYASMTPVQAAALPAILEGRDVRAQAKTGSGKTAAFGIGLLQQIDVTQFTTQALVLCPTRELADQVSKELRRLARFTQNIKILTLCGGQPISHQLDSLVHAPHIVVGTPGRIQEHLRKKSVSLDAMKVLVLDEADRMLDMGFADAIDDVISYTPTSRQTLLFSATYPQGIERISARIQREPVNIETGDVSALPDIEQQFYETSRGEKLALLQALLSNLQPASCVVFCNTKRDCQDVYEALSGQNISVLALHGDLEQRERDQVLVRFSNRSCRVLVATDVAARGLDIKELYAAYFSPRIAERPDLEDQLKDELDAIIKLRNYIAPASKETNLKPQVFEAVQTLHRNMLATMSLMIDAYWSSRESHLLIESEPALSDLHQLIPQALESLQNKLCLGIANNQISGELRQKTHDLHELVLKSLDGKITETPFYAYVWLSLEMLRQLTELNDQLHSALYQNNHRHLFKNDKLPSEK